MRRLWCWEQPWGQAAGRAAPCSHGKRPWCARGHERFSTRQTLGNDHGKCNPGWTGGGGTAGNEPHVLFICLKSRSSHCVPVHACPSARRRGQRPPQKVHTQLLQNTAFGWERASFPFGISALSNQALPLWLSAMFPVLPFQQIPSHPGLVPICSTVLRLELRGFFFPPTKLVFQRRVVFLLEKDPTGPTQTVILGHVLHRIPIFLSLDTLLPWDLFLKHSPKEKHLC